MPSFTLIRATALAGLAALIVTTANGAWGKAEASYDAPVSYVTPTDAPTTTTVEVSPTGAPGYCVAEGETCGFKKGACCEGSTCESSNSGYYSYGPMTCVRIPGYKAGTDPTAAPITTAAPTTTATTEAPTTAYTEPTVAQTEAPTTAKVELKWPPRACVAVGAPCGWDSNTKMNTPCCKPAKCDSNQYSTSFKYGDNLSRVCVLPPGAIVDVYTTASPITTTSTAAPTTTATTQAPGTEPYVAPATTPYVVSTEAPTTVTTRGCMASGESCGWIPGTETEAACCEGSKCEGRVNSYSYKYGDLKCVLVTVAPITTTSTAAPTTTATTEAPVTEPSYTTMKPYETTTAEKVSTTQKPIEATTTEKVTTTQKPIETTTTEKVRSTQKPSTTTSTAAPTTAGVYPTRACVADGAPCESDDGDCCEGSMCQSYIRWGGKGYKKCIPTPPGYKAGPSPTAAPTTTSSTAAPTTTSSTAAPTTTETTEVPGTEPTFVPPTFTAYVRTTEAPILIIDPVPSTDPVYPTKCRAEGEKCRGATGYKAVEWMSCCKGSCNKPADDWGFVCATGYVEPTYTTMKPYETTTETMSTTQKPSETTTTEKVTTTQKPYGETTTQKAGEKKAEGEKIEKMVEKVAEVLVGENMKEQMKTPTKGQKAGGGYDIPKIGKCLTTCLVDKIEL